MIPLRSSQPVKKFPRLSLAIVMLFLLAHLISWIPDGPREDWIQKYSFVPELGWHVRSLGALFLHGNGVLLSVTLIFLWAFTPRLFERRNSAVSLGLALIGWALSLALFAFVHPHATAPVLCPEAFVGALLGMYMRRDIWGGVTTLVPGIGWVRIFEVPSYVLLFVWFFYMLVGNLFLRAPFSDAPMLYLLPFAGFLWGFLTESILPKPLD